jgi:hypothetical protein
MRGAGLRKTPRTANTRVLLGCPDKDETSGMVATSVTEIVPTDAGCNIKRRLHALEFNFRASLTPNPIRPQTRRDKGRRLRNAGYDGDIGCNGSVATILFGSIH